MLIRYLQTPSSYPLELHWLGETDNTITPRPIYQRSSASASFFPGIQPANYRLGQEPILEQRSDPLVAGDRSPDVLLNEIQTMSGDLMPDPSSPSSESYSDPFLTHQSNLQSTSQEPIPTIPDYLNINDTATQQQNWNWPTDLPLDTQLNTAATYFIDPKLGFEVSAMSGDGPHFNTGPDFTNTAFSDQQHWYTQHRVANANRPDASLVFATPTQPSGSGQISEIGQGDLGIAPECSSGATLGTQPNPDVAITDTYFTTQASPGPAASRKGKRRAGQDYDHSKHLAVQKRQLMNSGVSLDCLSVFGDRKDAGEQPKRRVDRRNRREVEAAGGQCGMCRARGTKVRRFPPGQRYMTD